MNVRLTEVVSNITGLTSMLIIWAILDGQHDVAQLAAFRQAGCKNNNATIARALRGTWRDEHLFELARAYELYQTYQMKVTECDKRIEEAVGYGGWQVVHGRRIVASRGHSSGQLMPFMVAVIGSEERACRDQTIPYPTSYPSRSRKPVESYRGLQCRMSLLSRSCSS
jgi:hypothetical protein